MIETSRGYGRGMLRGIIRYAREHGPWSFYISPGDFEQALPKLHRWGGTGIIARIETPQIERAILQTRLPVIALDLSEEQLAPGNPLSRICEVYSGSQKAAEMAAEYLLELGFRQYAFVGIANRIWSKRREEAFVKRIHQAGYPVYVYPTPPQDQTAEWAQDQLRLARWLQELPKPIGLMACNDDRGREVLEAARGAGVYVPEEMAVIGVDNDELLCELADPPLSSVALNTEVGGYRTAALLDDLMHGRRRRAQRIEVEPLGVISRRSTELTAIEDPEVAEAVRFIRSYFDQPIRVEDVVSHVALSRRNLELRFRRYLGRTIHAEILRCRLNRAVQLLQMTDWPIPQVAEATGFSSHTYFAAVIRRYLGTSPLQYRRQLRK
ncbi:MAG: XylR family transcriptional regulator [Thermoguttaceae bacterium]|nr:XylR family transcriptional regulator [Thermoguttaceae bacterium]MDW8037792.1 XylR family transcriptional regulator [Thermoguttaceae bacterium]